MNGTDLITGRKSIRKYKDEVVSREKIEAVMEEVRFTQSWGNSQTARFTFISDLEKIEQIMNEGVNGFVYNVKTLKHAKNIMVLSFVHGKSGKFDDGDYVTSKGAAWEIFDNGIACQTFCLAAYNHGIGSCVMGVIDDKKIHEIASLPEEETVGALITFGYPNEEGRVSARLSVDELCTFL